MFYIDNTYVSAVQSRGLLKNLSLLFICSLTCQVVGFIDQAEDAPKVTIINLEFSALFGVTAIFIMMYNGVMTD